MSQPEDHVYRLKTKWRGNDLHCRMPFGFWTKVGTFEDGRFVERSDDAVIVFEKVRPGRLHEETLLLKDREPHDYRGTPSGELLEKDADAP
jgi:hypothetical protein